MDSIGMKILNPVSSVNLDMSGLLLTRIVHSVILVGISMKVACQRDSTKHAKTVLLVMSSLLSQPSVQVVKTANITTGMMKNLQPAKHVLLD